MSATEHGALARPVTGLYVPGDRPDRFAKAVASGADLVILDLEDAVAPEAKDAARESVLNWLAGLTAPTADLVAEPAAGPATGTVTRPVTGPATNTPRQPLIQVRVNAGSRADLAALATVSYPVQIRLPKVETLDQLAEAHERTGHRIAALIESARGVESAALLAQHPAVDSLALGESDLRSELVATAPAVIEYARVRVLYASVAAGLPAPMMSAYPRIRDLDGLLDDTLAGRALGWFGRTAIHPTQLDVIRRAFRPEPAEIEWANAVLAAVAGGGVTTLASGEMVDRAMVGRAHAILSAANILSTANQTP